MEQKEEKENGGKGTKKAWKRDKKKRSEKEKEKSVGKRVNVGIENVVCIELCVTIRRKIIAI